LDFEKGILKCGGHYKKVLNCDKINDEYKDIDPQNKRNGARL